MPEAMRLRRKNSLHLKPHHTSGEPGWWWYEEPRGITVVLSSDLTGDRNIMVKIAWRALRNALVRKDGV